MVLLLGQYSMGSRMFFFYSANSLCSCRNPRIVLIYRAMTMAAIHTAFHQLTEHFNAKEYDKAETTLLQLKVRELL